MLWGLGSMLHALGFRVEGEESHHDLWPTATSTRPRVDRRRVQGSGLRVEDLGKTESFSLPACWGRLRLS